MTDDAKKTHRTSLSVKAYGGKVFFNASIEFDDPNDPAEVELRIAEIKSLGYTAIQEALHDRVDEEVQAQIERIKGARTGGHRGTTPQPRQITPPAPRRPATIPSPIDQEKPSTMDQRNRIREIIEAEHQAGGHPARRAYLEAVMKQEQVDHFDDLSFPGAGKVLAQIDETQETAPDGFQTGTAIAAGDYSAEEVEVMEADAQAYDENLARCAAEGRGRKTDD